MKSKFSLCAPTTTFSVTLTGLTDFAACLIFTFHRKEILNDSRDLGKGRFGYCFILAWLCVPLLLISGVLYGHLRKKEWRHTTLTFVGIRRTERAMLSDPVKICKKSASCAHMKENASKSMDTAHCFFLHQMLWVTYSRVDSLNLKKIIDTSKVSNIKCLFQWNSIKEYHGHARTKQNNKHTKGYLF